jgi:hypothetical protein
MSVPLYVLAHEVVGLHIPRMTQYNTMTKENNPQQPWIIFGDRYESEGRRYLPFHLTFSHATLTPKLVEDYLHKFTYYAQLTREEVMTFSEFIAIADQEDNATKYGVTNHFEFNPYAPGYQRHLQRAGSFETTPNTPSSSQRARM